MSNVSINIRTDAEIKLQAETFLSELGLNMTTVFNMFLRQMIRNQEIPLQLSLRPNANEQSNDSLINNSTSNKNLLDLMGKVDFDDAYDYKSMRVGS